MNSETIKKLYGNSVRLRVCGLYEENNSLLLIKHKGLGEKGIVWLPPGGGVEYGLSLEENLKREFLEETGLSISVGEFLFLYEFRNNPFHAIELFFKVDSIKGVITKGTDPEYSKEDQIIEKTEFKTYNELNTMKKNLLHGIFSHTENAKEVINLRGFYKI